MLICCPHLLIMAIANSSISYLCYVHNSVILHLPPQHTQYTPIHTIIENYYLYINFHRKVPQLFLKWAPQYFHVDVKTQRLPNQTKMFEPSIVRSFIHVFAPHLVHARRKYTTISVPYITVLCYYEQTSNTNEKDTLPLDFYTYCFFWF
jgi:hypothetical protein